MVTMHRGPNWKISVYGREHGLPHFHIEGPGFRCSVGLATLDLLIGSAPANVRREALVWAEANRALLLAQWQELNS
jgi:Domain of unknown function (DUF4160)